MAKYKSEKVGGVAAEIKKIEESRKEYTLKKNKEGKRQVASTSNLSLMRPAGRMPRGYRQRNSTGRRGAGPYSLT